jgi:NAD(P)-dependent dehydrogenase (short-subunit alcohol dehydrogenase family)
MVEGSTNATGLQGKVVLVTGAAAGIGRATAIRFARERCRIVAWDVNEAVQEELQRQICDQGGELIFRKTDVSNSKDVEDGVQEMLPKPMYGWRRTRHPLLQERFSRSMAGWSWGPDQLFKRLCGLHAEA